MTILLSPNIVFFFFPVTVRTAIYTLSLHDALPIYVGVWVGPDGESVLAGLNPGSYSGGIYTDLSKPLHEPPPNPTLKRSEEHTSELQSHSDLVCRLLLEKKKKR